MDGLRDDSTKGQNVVPLPHGERVAEGSRPPPPSRTRGLHGVAIAGMSLFAFIGIFSMLAFITVRWPEATGRYVMAVFIFSIVGFITSASVAIFSAARNTYPSRSSHSEEVDEAEQ